MRFPIWKPNASRQSRVPCLVSLHANLRRARHGVEADGAELTSRACLVRGAGHLHRHDGASRDHECCARHRRCVAVGSERRANETPKARLVAFAYEVAGGKLFCFEQNFCELTSLPLRLASRPIIGPPTFGVGGPNRSTVIAAPSASVQYHFGYTGFLNEARPARVLVSRTCLYELLLCQRLPLGRAITMTLRIETPSAIFHRVGNLCGVASGCQANIRSGLLRMRSFNCNFPRRL
jgi:hypothetical protein